jgi:hypothetical protein
MVSQLNHVSQTFLNDYNNLYIMFITGSSVNSNHKHCLSTGYEHTTLWYDKDETVAVVQGAIGIERDSLARRNS